jgi:hypothetical protein
VASASKRCFSDTLPIRDLEAGRPKKSGPAIQGKRGERRRNVLGIIEAIRLNPWLGDIVAYEECTKDKSKRFQVVLFINLVIIIYNLLAYDFFLVKIELGGRKR